MEQEVAEHAGGRSEVVDAQGEAEQATEEAETGGARRRLGWERPRPPPRMRLSYGLAAKCSTCYSTGCSRNSARPICILQMQIV
jgi:hypothetical protein